MSQTAVEEPAQPNAATAASEEPKAAATENVQPSAAAPETSPAAQIMITSDLEQIQEMYDAQNMTRGIASRACMSQEQHKAAVKRQ